MTLDLVSALKTEFTTTPLVVTGGGATVTLPAKSSRERWTATDAFLYFTTLDRPHERANIGGGGEKVFHFVELHAAWEDRAEITDPEAFTKAVRDGIVNRIRSKEKTLAGNFVWVEDVIDLVELLGVGTTPLKNEILATIASRDVEVY